MKSVGRLIGKRGDHRLFFASWVQSSAGNGLGYVALMLLAYEQFESPWVVSAVLLADYLPAMLGGPLIGAVVDRFSRKWCAVAGDAMNALAFAALAIGLPLHVVLGFAALAGLGNALHDTAVLAGLPSLVDEEDEAAAMSLYNTIEEGGFVLGPLLAAALLSVAGLELLLVANAVSFACSAVVLAIVDFRRAIAHDRPEPLSLRSLTADTRAGLRAVGGMPDVRRLLFVFFGCGLAFGLVNVGEVLLALDEFGVGRSSFSLLIGLMSLGMLAGALSGTGRASETAWSRRLILAMAFVTLGCLLAAASELTFVVAASFVLLGFGNGSFIVHANLLMTRWVPDAFRGRVFGLRRSVSAWIVASAYLSAGALSEATGARVVFLVAGLCALVALSYGVTWLPAAARRRREVAPAQA